MKDKRAFFFVVKMKMLPVLRVMLEKYGQDPCPWYPILSSHAGGAALQGKCLVRRVLMNLTICPFIWSPITLWLDLGPCSSVLLFSLAGRGYIYCQGKDRVPQNKGVAKLASLPLDVFFFAEVSQSAIGCHGSPLQMLTVAAHDTRQCTISFPHSDRQPYLGKEHFTFCQEIKTAACHRPSIKVPFLAALGSVCSRKEDNFLGVHVVPCYVGWGQPTGWRRTDLAFGFSTAPKNSAAQWKHACKCCIVWSFPLWILSLSLSQL